MSEKSYSLITDRKYTFRVHEDAHKTQIRQAVEELFEVKVQNVNILKVQSKPKRRGFTKGRRPGWKKAIVQLSEGHEIEIFEGAARLDGPEEVQADEPRAPLHGDLGLRGDHQVGAGEVAPRAADEEGRPQQPRPDHDAPPGRRSQAPLPHDRLQADEGRRPGEGGRDRVRPEPVGSDRAPALRRRREVVHPRPVAAPRRRDRRVRARAADIKPGNALPLANIPTGTLVHSVELKPGQGGRMARSAGSSVQLVAKDGDHGVLRLPSGELRRVLLTCRATVGQVGNTDHANQSSGKAGRSRWLGKRPTVRGSAMNPVDHPHGGGEGKTKGGRHPVTPWGVPTLGKRTRRKHKESDKLIVRGRRRGKERKR